MRASIALRAAVLWLAFLLAAASGVSVAAGAAMETERVRHGQGSWTATCEFVRQAPDDPIVHPGHFGASHLHDFFGNPSIDARSTRGSLLGTRGTCGAPGDRSAYWSPALVDPESGQAAGIEPLGMTVQFLVNGRDPEAIVPFPEGLEAIGGDAGATSPQPTDRVGWACGEPGQPVVDVVATPPLCAARQVLSARIDFPDCSSGRPQSRDHLGHLAYSKTKGGKRFAVCPRSHPIAIPGLRLIVNYPPAAAQSAALASGGIYSLHADFFEAWKPGALRRVVDSCLRGDRRCVR